MRIKTGDTVIVIAGKEKGKTGKVLKTLPKENRVIVENLNMVTKHMKMRGPNLPSGIQRVEAPIHVSNVAYYDSSSKKATKVGYKVEGNKKVRIAKSTGSKID
ncbi:MAG: 50S ribosomal protein L24 [Tissierellia bacterium]|nr:50S ribosomal protein L24 [Tissierellia bacterium]